MKKVSYSICEYGLVRCIDDYQDATDLPLQEIYINSKHFNSLYNYIANNQDDSKESERAFLLLSKGRRRQIKVKNFVGVIETSDGLHLEILPKIHLNSEANAEFETKKIFLKMLKHLKNSPFINVSSAHLQTNKDFPILEIFIKSYIDEVERNFQRGIKHDYVLHQENVSFMKGKIKVSENIKFNHTSKVHFFCEFSDYSSNISLNIIIKTTLSKLLKISNNYQNIYAINKLLTHLGEVQYSKNISLDLSQLSSSNRLIKQYSSIVDWSKIFLVNKSFTNFKGESENMAILFPMEKVFEDYLAYLFKKFAGASKIKTQDKTYFLVEHKRERRFGLRPDIIIDQDNTRQKIVDTKWKLLNEYSSSRNYNISQSDMYQLYAYGKKYSTLLTEPRLVLLYPSNPNFTSKLEKFIYEGDLQLEVIPFNFNLDEKEQIEYIINL